MMRRVAPRRVWPAIAFGASMACWYEHISRTICLVICKNHRIWEFLTKLLTRNRCSLSLPPLIIMHFAFIISISQNHPTLYFIFIDFFPTILIFASHETLTCNNHIRYYYIYDSFVDFHNIVDVNYLGFSLHVLEFFRWGTNLIHINFLLAQLKDIKDLIT